MRLVLAGWHCHVHRLATCLVACLPGGVFCPPLPVRSIRYQDRGIRSRMARSGRWQVPTSHCSLTAAPPPSAYVQLQHNEVDSGAVPHGHRSNTDSVTPGCSSQLQCVLARLRSAAVQLHHHAVTLPAGCQHRVCLHVPASAGCPSSCDTKPNCHCASDQIPGGLAPKDTPMFVVLVGAALAAGRDAPPPHTRTHARAHTFGHCTQYLI